MSYGYHLVSNIGACNPKKIRCVQTIAFFSKTLIHKTNMTPRGEPWIVHAKAGYTLVQINETSNISAHFVENTNDAYLDIFSTKPFDKHLVSAIFYAYFQPKNERTIILRRNVEVKNELSLDNPVLLK